MRKETVEEDNSETVEAKPNLGLVEGFYGKMWSFEDRMSYISFLKENGFSFYIYAPKWDIFLRKQWHEEWPNETKEKFKELSYACKENDIRFGIGLTPYGLFAESDQSTREKLIAKARSINAVKPDILCILFDDMRGDIPDLAEMQADSVHAIAEVTVAEQVFFCPTYYSFEPALQKLFGKMPPNYFSDVGKLLDQEIGICWTGEKVRSREFPIEHFREMGEVFRRKPVLWDNYPVNDGLRHSKYLNISPFENRSPSLVSVTRAHMANPMNQAFLSRIPLKTLPLCYETPTVLDPAVVFKKTCEELCGDELGGEIFNDSFLFQSIGLDGMGEERRTLLKEKYAQFLPSPYAKEIIDWLNGVYRA